MKGTVLLVEDERDTRELLSRAIERADWRCVIAGEPREALERAKDAGFIDVVVTDVVLGADDRAGLALMSELRRAGVPADDAAVDRARTADSARRHLHP